MAATVRDSLAGRLLDNRYRVEELIARGGMASVYRATDTRLGRTVAVKVMAPPFTDDPDFVARFSREAQAAAGIYDGHVVIVHDQGADDGVVYLVMEYVPGHTLRDLLAERGRLAPDEALDVIEPVLAALRAAHGRGLVHRDVKPENVLIGVDGRVKVTDFGLAKAAAGDPTSTRTQGVLMGTMAYLAPEQTRGIADARSDVYSAGIMLFEMLTGTVPFSDDSALGLAYRHVHDVVPAPSTVTDGVPGSVDALVLRLTQQDADARPRDGGAALALVAQARRGLRGPAQAPAPAAEDQPTLVVPVPRTAPAPGATSAVATAPPSSVAPPIEGVVVAPGPGRRRRSKGWIALVLVVLLAITAGATAWWLGTGRFTTVPGVVGIAAKQAEAKLAEQGLTHEYADPEYSEIVPAGQVLTTDPAAGERVERGGVVVLTLSRGPERYDVPDVVGMPLDKARQKLANRTLTADVSRVFSEKVPEGRVISSKPKAGVEVRAKTVVDLVVSKGPPPVEVPNLVGVPFADASATLAGLGLQIRQVGARFAEGTDQGDVLSQDPGTGQVVRKGTTVEVVVSKGPPFVTVPDLRGMGLGDATDELERLGLHADVQRVCFLVCFGLEVTDQDPDPGTRVRQGATVSLVAE